MIRNQLIKNIIAIAVMLVAITGSAAEPQGYYSAAEGKTGEALLKALEGIVGPHTSISYSGLWDMYKTTDVDDNGYIIDMYSTVKFKPGTDQCGSYSNVGDCYNREHSFPKSWFNDASPMVTDAMHLIPTDGKVNGQRSNYPFGVCANGTYLQSSSKGKPLGKLGKSTYPGYSGTVFEPDDLYKGDFARIYFYMATAYNSRVKSWDSDMLNNTSYPAFSSWAINMLLEWSRQDVVSDKEVKRNQAVYGYQKNRNPFVDHPELAEYIWGNKVGQPWYANSTADPMIIAPTSNSTINFGVVATGSTSSATVTVKGTNLDEDLEISVSGEGFTTSATTVSASDAMAGKVITVYYTASGMAGLHTGTLTIESSECATVRVPMQATVVTGIPASVANITNNSFEAKWISQGDATKYDLYVYKEGQNTVMNGYPVSVNASAGKYTVTGLEPLTTYRFMLKSNALESNVVEATTLDVEHIINIVTDGGTFSLNAARGQNTLPVLEARVYTENVNEDVTLTMTGEKFDISLDRQNWSKSLTIDGDGETFFVRLNSVATAGTFTGVLTASSQHYDGSEVDIVANVEAPAGGYLVGDVNGDGEVDVSDINCLVNAVLNGPNAEYEGREDTNLDNEIDVTDINVVINIILGKTPPAPPAQTETYTEDWEDCESNFGYATKDIQGHQWKWNITDVGIYADTQKHGTLSCRLGKTKSSTITMAEDITTGASKVSFYASIWSDSDGDISLALEYSTNGGTSWTKVKDFTINNTTLTQYTADVNVAGKVRFRFVQSNGARGNIDDITITNNPNAKAPAQQFTTGRDWEAVASNGNVTISTARKLKVEVYNLDAEQVAQFKLNGMRSIDLPAGTYIVVADKQSKKVIVK